MGSRQFLVSEAELKNLVANEVLLSQFIIEYPDLFREFEADELSEEEMGMELDAFMEVLNPNITVTGDGLQMKITKKEG